MSAPILPPPQQSQSVPFSYVPNSQQQPANNVITRQSPPSAGVLPPPPQLVTSQGISQAGGSNNNNNNNNLSGPAAPPSSSQITPLTNVSSAIGPAITSVSVSAAAPVNSVAASAAVSNSLFDELGAQEPIDEIIQHIFRSIDVNNTGRIRIEDAERTFLRMNTRLDRR